MKKVFTLTFFKIAFICNCCQAQTVSEQALEEYKKKHFDKAATLFLAAYERDKSNVDYLYNAASSYAESGDVTKAFEFLEYSINKGFSNISLVERDESFQYLHSDFRWAKTIKTLREKLSFDARLWNSEALSTEYKEDISENEKIAGLSKFWAEVKFNFVYVDTLKRLDWDSLYVNYLAKVRATKSTAEYYRVLMELCARLGDGHTTISPPYQTNEHFFAKPLLTAGLIEGKIILTKVLDQNLSTVGIEPGLEIIAVGGIPAKKYVEEQVAPLLSASTSQDMESAIYLRHFLEGNKSQAIEITFQNQEGAVFNRSIQRVSWEAWHKLAAPDSPFQFKLLNGKIAYVALNSFLSPDLIEKFISRFEEINASSAMILDIRRNEGGMSDIGYKILSMLTDKPFETSSWSTRDYKPVMRAWGKATYDFYASPVKWPPDIKRHYKKPVVLLTSGATYSAAEDFAVAFDVMRRGTILGEPTGGSTGQALSISLPGGGRAQICTKQDTYPDGKVFVGVGVQPNRLARPTVKDLRVGKDTVLEAALEMLQPSNNTN